MQSSTVINNGPLLALTAMLLGVIPWAFSHMADGLTDYIAHNASASSVHVTT